MAPIENQALQLDLELSQRYFVTKIFLTYFEKNCFIDRETRLKFETEGREFANLFEITRTIYSNSERSEQFLVTECFFNLFLEVSQI